jgi:hypothetical protein
MFLNQPTLKTSGQKILKCEFNYQHVSVKTHANADVYLTLNGDKIHKKP